MSGRSDDDELDDASLKSMRAVWLSMRDEEPPAAGMSALMAAAAQKADQMREQPSWWQRLFAQLRRPPALAFATVMLLIGGAVLVTRSQHEKVDALTADTPAAAPEQMQSREVAQRQEDQAPTSTPTVAAPADSVLEEKADPAKPTTPQLDSRGKIEKQKPKARPPVTAKETEVGKNEPDRNNRFEADVDVNPGFTGSKSGEDKTVLESPAGKGPTPQTVPPADPSPPAMATDEGDTLTRDNAGTAKKPAAVKDSPAPRAAAKPKTNEELAKQAETHAARGDCVAVREIVAQLRRNDEAFYKQRLGKNTAVAKCL